MKRKNLIPISFLTCHTDRLAMPSKMCLAIECWDKRGIGSIMRCAAAFGASEIAVVGSFKFGTHGAHGAQKYVPVMHFYHWDDCLKYMKEQSFQTISISPMALFDSDECKISSAAIDSFTCRDNVCFVIGTKDVSFDI